MIKALQKIGYTVLIDVCITPLPSWNEANASITFIDKIMEQRGVEIKASQWLTTYLDCLDTQLISRKILSPNHIVTRLLAMSLDIIVRFPLVLLTCIPFSIIFATKFIFSFIAFSLFCASTNQDERNAIASKNPDLEVKKLLPMFALEYMWTVLILFVVPFAVLAICLRDGIASKES